MIINKFHIVIDWLIVHREENKGLKNGRNKKDGKEQESDGSWLLVRLVIY